MNLLAVKSQQRLSSFSTVNIQHRHAKGLLPLPQMLPQAARVNFSGQTTLLKKYGINPKNVRIVTPPGSNITIPNVAEVMTRVLQAHEHALKNQKLENLSGRYYATNMQLENGQWEVGTNHEQYPESMGIVCGERSSMVVAWNRALSKLKLDQLESPDAVDKARAGTKVKMLAMSGAASPTDPSAGNPCAECQSWMARERYFSPDTLIASLHKDSPDAGGQYYLNVKRVSDLLPMWGKKETSLTTAPLTQVFHNPDISEKAKDVMSAKGIQPEDLFHLMTTAIHAYRENPTAAYSGKNAASAILLNNKDVVSGARFDWTQRWYLDTDLSTAGKAIQNVAKTGAPPPKIEAIAYYGDDKNMPSEPTLGVLAQPGRGSQDTLIAVIEHDKLHVRTVTDYMRSIYISNFKSPPPKPLVLPADVAEPVQA